MQSAHWAALIRKIPAEFHNQLSITTTGGTEIIVQSFQMLDGECLIIKGRMSASQDTGRLFFVPYDQIDYVGFLRAVSEEDTTAWFGPASVVAAKGTPAEEPANGSARTPMPSRAALLERIRARNSSNGI
jgi:hypothetical protein